MNDQVKSSVVCHRQSERCLYPSIFIVGIFQKECLLIVNDRSPAKMTMSQSRPNSPWEIRRSQSDYIDVQDEVHEMRSSLVVFENATGICRGGKGIIKAVIAVSDRLCLSEFLRWVGPHWTKIQCARDHGESRWALFAASPALGPNDSNHPNWNWAGKNVGRLPRRAGWHFVGPGYRGTSGVDVGLHVGRTAYTQSQK